MTSSSVPTLPATTSFSLKTSSAASVTPSPVRFGVIGAGFIAELFAQTVADQPRAQIAAVTSARPERARAFADKHSIPAAHTTLDHMLADDTVTAIYVASPNSLHGRHVIAALDAGKDVLVEKPFATSVDEAEAMVSAARSSGRLLMEAWLGAFEPGTTVIRDALPRLGTLSRAVLVKEQYSSRFEAYKAGQLPPAFDPAAAGGSIMDLGVYPVSLAIHLFGEPERVTATGCLLDSGVDSHGTIILGYPGGLEVVCLHSKVSANGIDAEITGERSALVIDDCQWPQRIELRTTEGGQMLVEDLSVTRTGTSLAYELAEFCTLVQSGARQSTRHPLSASLTATRVLTEARRQVGVVFPQ